MMKSCPSDDQISDLLNGRLTVELRQTVEDHIETCTSCQEKLDNAPGTENPFSERRRNPDSADSGWSNQIASRLADVIRQSSFQEPEAAPSSEMPQVAGYEILEKIGVGGMGVVYRALQFDLEREVALKILAIRKKRHLSLAERRFSHEARVTAHLDHNSIVPVYSIGNDHSGRCYYTMRLVRGRELRAMLNEYGSWAENQQRTRVIEILIRVCETIEYAHSRGVIHRDLKPSNIMVGDLGEVYVLDWGLARMADCDEVRDIRPEGSYDETAVSASGDSALTAKPITSSSSAIDSHDSPAPSSNDELKTMDGSIIGTPVFMPPEQAIGNVWRIDERSDVYSLGAVLYQALAGQPPYASLEERSNQATLKAVIEGPPQSLSQVSDKIPQELVAICERAMARDKAQRYESALALAADLRAFIERRVVKAYRTGLPAVIGKWAARNPLFAAISLLFAIACVVGPTVYSLNQARLNRLLGKANERAGNALQEQNRVSNKLAATNNELGDRNQQLAAANEKIKLALSAEATAKLEEKQAKEAAQSILADSFMRLGELEAKQNNYQLADLWFIEAAKTTPDKELAQIHRRRAAQFRRRAPEVVAAWWDRKVLKLLKYLEWPMPTQFLADPSSRFVAYRGTRAQFLEVRILDLKKLQRQLWLQQTFKSVAFSPTKSHVAVARSEKNVAIYQLLDEKLVYEIPNSQPQGRVHLLDYSPNGKQLLILNESARIWQIDERKFLPGVIPVEENAFDMGFSRDGNRVLIQYNKKVQVFPVTTDSGTIAPLEVQNSPKLKEEFLLKQKQTHVARQPDSSPVTPELLERRGAHGGEVHGLSFDATGRYVSKAHGNGIVRRWRLEAPKSYWYMRNRGWSRGVISPDSKFIAARGIPMMTALATTETQVHDPMTGEHLGPKLEIGVPILDACFSSNSQLLALACSVKNRNSDTVLLGDGKGGTVQIWDWRSGKLQASIPMPSEPQVIIRHPHLPYYVVGCAAGHVIKVHAVEHRTELLFKTEVESRPSRHLPGDFTVVGMRFSNDGQFVYWFGFSEKNYIIDFGSGESRRLHGQISGIFQVKNRLLASYIAYQGATFLDPKSLKPRRSIAGGRVTRVSRNQSLVVSTSAQSSIQVFNVDKQRPACPDIKHAQSDVDFVSDTPFIISCGHPKDPSVRIWDLKIGRIAAPVLEPPAASLISNIDVAPNGRFATLMCVPYGVLVYDLRSLHSNVYENLPQSDADQLAEVNTGFRIRDGRLTILKPEAGIEHWDRIQQQMLTLHQECESTALRRRDLVTRATEFEVLKMPEQAKFYRSAAKAALNREN